MPIVSTIPGVVNYAPTYDTQGAPVDQGLLSTLDDLADVANALSLTLPSMQMTETLMGGNAWSLGAGEHGGAAVSHPGVSVISGATPAAAITNKVVCQPVATTVIAGVRLSGSGNPGEPMLLLHAGARVLLRDCVLDRGPLDQSLITVTTGAKLIVTNCVFTGMQATGTYVISHTGPAANLHVAYCYDLTNSTAGALAASMTAAVGVLT